MRESIKVILFSVPVEMLSFRDKLFVHGVPIRPDYSKLTPRFRGSVHLNIDQKAWAERFVLTV